MLAAMQRSYSLERFLSNDIPPLQQHGEHDTDCRPDTPQDPGPPELPAELSVDEWLVEAGLGSYAAAFAAAGYDELADLKSMDPVDFQALAATVQLKPGAALRLKQALSPPEPVRGMRRVESSKSLLSMRDGESDTSSVFSGVTEPSSVGVAQQQVLQQKRQQQLEQRKLMQQKLRQQRQRQPEQPPPPEATAAAATLCLGRCGAWHSWACAADQSVGRESRVVDCRGPCVEPFRAAGDLQGDKYLNMARYNMSPVEFRDHCPYSLSRNSVRDLWATDGHS